MEDQKKEEEQEVNAEEENLSEEYSIKHPLQNTWSLWYYESDKSKEWGDNLREIFSFDTIEDFWSLYNNIKRPSELKPGCDYSLFKKGVKPMWEDVCNKNGGRWLISLDRKQRSSDLDKYWLEIILCMIGEAFDSYSDDICGSVVNVRNKGDKIGLWTANAQKACSIMSIGHKIKEQLKIPKGFTLGYQAHSDLAQKNSSLTKNSYEFLTRKAEIRVSFGLSLATVTLLTYYYHNLLYYTLIIAVSVFFIKVCLRHCHSTPHAKR